MRVCICERPFRLELSTFRATGAAITIVHANAHEAREYLQSRARPPFAVDQLRKLLEGRGARRLASDDEVWREAAAQLMAGRLYLTQSEEKTFHAAAIADLAATAPAPKRPIVSPSPPLPPPRKQEPEALPPPEPDVTARLEQDVQAGALEQAAKDGTPFCEVCEKARAAQPA